MKKTIGGKISTDMHFFELGRHALTQISGMMSLTSYQTILMPAYCCPSMVEPFSNSCKIIYYKILPDMQIDWEDLYEKATAEGEPCAILYTNYFGFPQDVTELYELRKQHMLIEDFTHGQFGRYENGEPQGSIGHYAMASLAKVWDTQGAILLHGPNRQRILDSFFDMFSIHAIHRRANWEYLKDNLKPKNAMYLFKELPEHVIPTHFPVIYGNYADKVETAFKLNLDGVHTPTIWKLETPIIFASEHKLSDMMLTLPIDHRYSSVDLDRIIEIVNGA